MSVPDFSVIQRTQTKHRERESPCMREKSKTALANSYLDEKLNGLGMLTN